MMKKTKPNSILKLFIFVIIITSSFSVGRVKGGDLKPSPTQIPNDSIAKKVDEIFSGVNTSDSPGVAVAVIKNGDIIFRRGYGMADLENGVQITPTTKFHVGSISKQFTAMAIQMLIQEGRLLLDDDVRKFLPELPDFGKTITVRHLLNHTSGLREQLQLLFMAGWRLEDVVTEDDLLRMIGRQRELNFEPGAEFLYSNTNYTLLALLVQRASGKPLAQYAAEKIFRPLEMTNTRFRDDYRTVTRNLALSYIPTPQGVKHMFISGSYVGSSGLMTTVEDLARWDKNFYSREAGGSEVIERMLTRGRLKDGQEIDYASGLNVGRQYLGLRTVEHTGEDAGYVADFLQFPDQRFSVIVLSNSGAFDAVDTARRVAELYLADEIRKAQSNPITAPTPQTRTEISLAPRVLEAFVGDYKLPFGIPIKLLIESGKLAVRVREQPQQTLAALSSTEFATKDASIHIRFLPPEGGKYLRLKIELNNQQLDGERIERLSLSPSMAQAYGGTYYSEELGALYSISYKNGQLMLWHRRGEEPLLIKHQDQFVTGFSEEARRWRGGEYVRITFLRDRRNRATGFLLSMPTAWNVRFLKAEMLRN